MKRTIIIAAALLAACSKTPAAPADPWTPEAHHLYADMVREGQDPTFARKFVNDALALKEDDRGRFDKQSGKKADELAQVRSGACKSDPGLSYC